MSVKVKYKGEQILSLNTDTEKALATEGQYCEADIVVINTPDGGGAPVINPLSVTANGTYNAPSGVDGYSPVTVNVPQGITPTGNINITGTNVTDVTNYATAQVVDADLVASNIKKDVNILGIIGTFEGGGGSLPPGMTKQDMGSFTVVSDTLIANKTISHNLGVVPKIVFVYSDNNEVETYAVETVYAAIEFAEINYEIFADIATTGAVLARGQNLQTGSLTATDWLLRRNNTYYKAGVTYNWVAWA